MVNAEQIRAIEQLKLKLPGCESVDSRVNLLLVAAGVKPATELTLYGTARDTEPATNLIKRLGVELPPESTLHEELSEELELIEGWTHSKENYFPIESEYLKLVTNLLDTLDVVYHINTPELGKVHLGFDEEKLSIEHQTISIAKDQQTLEKLAKASPSVSASPAAKKMYGLCMGYPASAVDAFVEGRAISGRNIGKKDETYTAFLGYKVSPETPEEDAQVAKLWHDTTRELSPLLYQKVLAAESMIKKCEEDL